MLLSDAYRVSSAIRFKNQGPYHYGIGRTSPWPDEINPPSPDRTALQIEEVIGFKQITTLELVYPDALGIINYRGQNFSISDEANAFTNNARFVYLSGQLVEDQFPLTTFRQIGIVSGLTPTSDIVLPGSVVDSGTLEGIDNRTPIHRNITKTETLSYIIQF